MTVATLMQIDKLVLLLESPVFCYLRLQLLRPDRFRPLVQALYGILMLLPQSTAFDTLARRLKCVGSLSQVLTLPVPADVAGPKFEFAALLDHFRGTQARARASAVALSAAASIRQTTGLGSPQGALMSGTTSVAASTAAAPAPPVI